jgi:fucose 4-O-acetylase-like acetyltransferase
MCAVVFNHCFQDFFKSVLDREAGGRPWCQPDVARDPIGAYALARGAYMYLNLLGMPAFTLVSGICSRSLVRCATAGDGAGLATRSRRMIESLLVPYVIWQTVFLIYGTYGTGEFRPPPDHPVPFVSPVGVTWYLTALFAWRCSVQFIATLRNVVAVTFIVGLAVGFVDTPQTDNGGLPFLDYQRAVAFAPMFYVGATVLTEDAMSRLTTSKGGAWVRHVGWVVTIATPAVFTAVLRGGGVCFDEAQRWAWTMVRYVYFHVCVRVYGQFD